MQMPKTYGLQNSLPKLPVPSLEDTFSLYLQTVQPYVNENEFQQVKKRISAFVTSEYAKQLQELLLQRVQYSKPHWLEEWWDDLQYFAPRDPIAFYVNYFFRFDNEELLFENLPYLGESFGVQIERAAFLIRAALEFHMSLLTETAEPDFDGKEPRDMSAYLYMFSTCRIPDDPKDYLRTYAGSRHIAVLCKSRFFVFDVISCGGRVLSIIDIAKQLKKVVHEAQQLSNQPTPPPLSVLTADNRSTWTKFRTTFCSDSPVNVNSLQQIQSSIFLVCLDDSSPSTPDEAAWSLWVGNGSNRWFDKSIQFVVHANGVAGLNGEHSKLDGLPVRRLCDSLFEFEEKKSLFGSSNPTEDSLLQSPVYLPFVFTPSALQEIDQSLERFKKLHSSFRMHIFEWNGYGSDFIKKTAKMSPDSFFQMALQLSTWKMFQCPVPTYESASTKRYLGGRTETGRSVSNASKRWVQAMTSPSSSLQDRFQLLQAACKAHNQYMKRAVQAQGCDRHMYGLRMIAETHKLPTPAFVDELYWKSCYWQLSTSQLPSTHEGFYVGWGPVVPDGLGVCYTIRGSKLRACISSTDHPQVRAERFKSILEESLKEMFQLCTKASKL